MISIKILRLRTLAGARSCAQDDSWGAVLCNALTHSLVPTVRSTAIKLNVGSYNSDSFLFSSIILDIYKVQ